MPILDLPPEILEHILLQVDDIKSINECYYVCTEWTQTMLHLVKRYGGFAYQSWVWFFCLHYVPTYEYETYDGKRIGLDIYSGKPIGDNSYKYMERVKKFIKSNVSKTWDIETYSSSKPFPQLNNEVDKIYSIELNLS